MLPTHKNDTPKSNLKIFCFAIENLSAKSEFLICCALVFLFYLIYGYIAELIFTLEGVSGWFITLIQFFFYALFGIIENAGKTRAVPMKIYSLLAFLTLGTMVSCLILNEIFLFSSSLFRDSQIMLWNISIIQHKSSSKVVSSFQF